MRSSLVIRNVGQFVCAYVFLFISGFLCAQEARDTVVAVHASIQEHPPQILLEWTPAAAPVRLQKVFRRLKGAPVWDDIGTPGVATLSFADSAVTAGVAYEYFVYRDFDSSAPTYAAGYLSAGIRVPLVDQRGKVILLVDETMSAPLAAELARLESDLTGDGWIVLRRDVARATERASRQGARAEPLQQ